jgi:purine-binding chemotaxis protein CheW
MESSTMSPTRHAAAELYGSFHLGGTELALPVTDVQEVVNFPAVITQVPLAPAYLLGLFNLRGRLIPMVHLGHLLDLPGRGSHESAKVAIVDFRGARIGLLFDATGEILRVRSEEIVTFEESSASMIGGALKLNGGDRILQILNVDALHGLHGMPVPKADATLEPQRQRALLAQRRRQCVSFRVNDTRLALPMGAIHEIIRVPDLAHSVLASKLCLGRFNLRGNIVTVVDFASFLALPAGVEEARDGYEDPRRIVVIRQQDMFFGMLVHEVESIVGYRDDELLSIPSFDAARPHVFTGCVARAGMPDIILIDPAALFSDEVVAELTQGHHALYQADAAAEYGQQLQRSRVRETYVTFNLDRLMGMRIEQLREIIDYPSDVMQPPGSPSYVRGVFRLRQSLITIVDLRAIYGLQDYANVQATKLLVVENHGERFGLVVDDIENIVAIDVADKIRVPCILRQQIQHPFRDDMREVVELADQRTLMLLDAAPLAERLGSQAVH